MSGRHYIALSVVLLIATLAVIIPRERTLPELLADLRDKNPAIRERARVKIRQIGPPAIAFLTNSLLQKSITTPFPPAIAAKIPNRLISKEAAAMALVGLGTDAVDAIPALMIAVREPRSPIATFGHDSGYLAGRALSKMGTNALPHLRELLTVTDELELYRVIPIFRNMGEVASPVVPDLVKFIAIDGHLGDYVAETLLAISPRKIPITPDLLNHTNEKVRIRAMSLANPLTQISPADAVIIGLGSTNASDRFQANVKARSAMTGYKPTNENWLRVMHGPDMDVAREVLRTNSNR